MARHGDYDNLCHLVRWLLCPVCLNAREAGVGSLPGECCLLPTPLISKAAFPQPRAQEGALDIAVLMSKTGH